MSNSKFKRLCTDMKQSTSLLISRCSILQCFLRYLEIAALTLLTLNPFTPAVLEIWWEKFMQIFLNLCSTWCCDNIICYEQWTKTATFRPPLTRAVCVDLQRLYPLQGLHSGWHHHPQTSVYQYQFHLSIS